MGGRPALAAAVLAPLLLLPACASDGKSGAPPPPDAEAPLDVDEEPAESVLADLAIPEPRWQVETGPEARRLGGGGPEPAAATDTGVPDPTATAYVTDGVALITLGEGLLDAAGCVALLLDVQDGV